MKKKRRWVAYLAKTLGVVAGGLKLQVELLRLGMEVVSLRIWGGGDVLLPAEKRVSASLMAASDRGERTTEPGVMLGSSSMLFICVTHNESDVLALFFKD